MKSLALILLGGLTLMSWTAYGQVWNNCGDDPRFPLTGSCHTWPLNEGTCSAQNFTISSLGNVQPNTDYDLTICNNTPTPGNVVVSIIERVGFCVIGRSIGPTGTACFDLGNIGCTTTFRIRTNPTLPPGGLVMGVVGVQNFAPQPNVNYVKCSPMVYLYP
jgi:hypothetical protein